MRDGDGLDLHVVSFVEEERAHDAPGEAAPRAGAAGARPRARGRGVGERHRLARPEPGAHPEGQLPERAGGGAHAASRGRARRARAVRAAGRPAGRQPRAPRRAPGSRRSCAPRRATSPSGARRRPRATSGTAGRLISARSRRLLAAPPGSASTATSTRSCLPSRELQRAAREILAINQDAMQRKSDQARALRGAHDGARPRRDGRGGPGGALRSPSGSWRACSGRSPRSRRRCGASARATSTCARPSTGQDEIAALGEEFNTMAERLRHYRSSSLGELLQAQQASQAAIDSLPDPVLVRRRARRRAEPERRRRGALPPRRGRRAVGRGARARAARDRWSGCARTCWQGRAPTSRSGFDEAVKVEGSDGARAAPPARLAALRRGGRHHRGHASSCRT